jgi:hypothetical protein
MTINEWQEGVKKYDREDLTNFIGSIEKLLGWDDFFMAYGKDMRVLKTILEIERTEQAMKEKGAI